jgi:formate/nitrite transporter FocA (FNT family)
VLLALFVSTIFAAALITAMTWFVEGQESMLVRAVVAWIAGALLALGSFNHVIVATLEPIFGYLGLVTLNRLTQGKQGARKRASA